MWGMACIHGSQSYAQQSMTVPLPSSFVKMRGPAVIQTPELRIWRALYVPKSSDVWPPKAVWTRTHVASTNAATATFRVQIIRSARSAVGYIGLPSQESRQSE